MSAPLPLEGIRALTLEQVHALPWGTAFLADLGARYPTMLKSSTCAAGSPTTAPAGRGHGLAGVEFF